MNKTFIYNGVGVQPDWNPSAEGVEIGEIKIYNISQILYSVGLEDITAAQSIGIQDAITKDSARNIIEQFEARPKYAVSVSGYPDDDNVGSYRANAWATDLAEVMNPLFQCLPHDFSGSSDGRDLVDKYGKKIGAPFSTKNTHYSLLGTTPWMRFMKYDAGGEHNPHFDSPYFNEQNQYVTLYSWVLYLNDVGENDGGNLQFVLDGMCDVHEQDRPAGAFSDWHEMADETKVFLNIPPKCGCLIIFPHWICHQVEKFVGDFRIMIRGDVAYSIEHTKDYIPSDEMSPKNFVENVAMKNEGIAK